MFGGGRTLEGDVDLHGWWIDGDELVLDELRIGAGARVGTRAVLMPGADVGDGAEVEPGSVVSGRVPAGERWAGSPARQIGRAGEAGLQSRRPARPRAHALEGDVRASAWPLRACCRCSPSVPGILLLTRARRPSCGTFRFSPGRSSSLAPLIAASFIVTYALLVALVVRSVSPLVQAGLA